MIASHGMPAMYLNKLASWLRNLARRGSKSSDKMNALTSNKVLKLKTLQTSLCSFKKLFNLVLTY
ncbi:hypothetical protein RZN22_19080, partial [Bacillaceae bacterium S4-13-58]